MWNGSANAGPSNYEVIMREVYVFSEDFFGTLQELVPDEIMRVRARPIEEVKI